LLTRALPRRYLNPKGIIPATATFRKGENPEKIRQPQGVEPAEAPKWEQEEDLPGAAEEEG